MISTNFLKYISTSIILVLGGSFMLTAQEYTNDASLLQTKKTSIVLKASGIDAKKKEANQMAIKSALHTLMEDGIEGVNDNRPLLTPEEYSNASDYLNRFFNGNGMRYLSFVANYEEDKKPTKLPNNMFKAEVTMEIYLDALNKDLLRSNAKQKVASEKTVEEVSVDVYQPTIMVVPYKQGDRSYREILRETQYVDYRNAIARVQDALITKGFIIKDVMAVLEATEKSGLFESTTSIETMDSQLINNSGADVYVTVDAGHNTNSSGSVGSITIVAYERASGRLLSSKQGMSRRYQKGTYSDLFRLAIGNIINDFVSDMNLAYAKKAELGNTFVLRVSTGTDSMTDMDTTIDAVGVPLSDAIRLWLRKNALNGRFHVQGSTRDLIIFDEIQVPSKAHEGYFIDANDFALEIFSYLRNELGVNCDKRIDGSTIYITVNE